MLEFAWQWAKKAQTKFNNFSNCSVMVKSIKKISLKIHKISFFFNNISDWNFVFEFLNSFNFLYSGILEDKGVRFGIKQL